MNEIEFFGVKLATLGAAFIAAFLSVAVDLKSHSPLTAIGSLLCGVFIAAVATSPVIEFFELSATWEHATAAIFGISGRNLIVSVSRASKNPQNVIVAFFKIGKK